MWLPPMLNPSPSPVITHTERSGLATFTPVATVAVISTWVGFELGLIQDAMQLLAGDWIIPTKQKAIEYLVQTLEPDAYDSFFSWNFFDEILFRNEYFSSYMAFRSSSLGSFLLA